MPDDFIQSADMATLQARIKDLEGQLRLLMQRVAVVERPVEIESADGSVEISSVQPKRFDLSVQPPSIPMVAGTRALYKVPVCREYDSAGNLVAIGSETGAAGTIQMETWDVPRLHA